MCAIRLLLETEKWEESKESPGLGKHTQGVPTQRGCLITNPASRNTPSPSQPAPAPESAFLVVHSSPPDLSINNQGQSRCWKHKRLCHEELEPKIQKAPPPSP